MSLRRAGTGRTIGIQRTINDPVYNAYTVAQLADTPTALYELQEESGSTATDLSGNGHDGAYNGSPTKRVAGPGVVPYAVGFAGTTYADSVSVANASWMNGLGTTLAYECLAYFTSFDNYGHAISQDDGGVSGAGNRRFWFRNEIGSGGTTTWLTSTQPGGFGTLSLNTWYHLALNYNGSTVKTYRNGTEISSGNKSVSIIDTTIPFYIGRSAYADNTYTMMGRVAGVAIYHSGLSAARILAHAQAAGLA